MQPIWVTVHNETETAIWKHGKVKMEVFQVELLILCREQIIIYAASKTLLH